MRIVQRGLPGPLHFGQEAPLHLAVFGSWMIAFGAAALLEYAPNASLWFPPAAVTFAAILVMGIRALPVLWLGCLVVTVLADQVFQRGLAWSELLGAGLAFGLTHTLAYAAVALPLRAGASPFTPVTNLSKIIAFLIGGALAAGLSSLLGGLSLAATGMTDLASVPSLLAPWWIGDYAGLITVAPLFALLLARLASFFGASAPRGLRLALGPRPWRALMPLALYKLGGLALLTAAVLGTAAAFPEQAAMPFLLFVCLPVQMWIVHTENELATLLGIVIFSLLLAAAAGLSNLADHALMLQFIVISLAVSSYLGLAVPSLYRDNRRMRQLLTHDSLTGALTRNFFEDASREALQQSTQRQQPACLVMIDLDELKLINDQHGHAAGDRALKTLATTCAQKLAPGQLLGRLSGDEFALFLGESRREDAEHLLETIRLELAACPPIAGDQRVSASTGIAEFDPTESSAGYRQLLAEADQAMYQSKRRNARGR